MQTVHKTAGRQRNDTKRAEMAELMKKAEAAGFSRKTLSSMFGVSLSTLSSWARGASMGTNAQRAGLAHLVANGEGAEL